MATKTNSFEPWYNCIEAQVREIVRELRNNGINTTCSCGHNMTIEAESYDPTSEYKTIYNILYRLGHNDFELIFQNSCNAGVVVRVILIQIRRG